MMDLNEREIEFTEVEISGREYEQRLVRLISALLALDESLGQEEIEPAKEAA